MASQISDWRIERTKNWAILPFLDASPDASRSGINNAIIISQAVICRGKERHRMRPHAKKKSQEARGWLQETHNC